MTSEPIIRRDYLSRRRPCWLCSASLMQVLFDGPNEGKFVAAIRMIDGFERQTHVSCSGLLDEQGIEEGEDERQR